MEKKVFIIIPCYNEAAVIKQTVEELLQYGYDIVVVDDASTDNSAKELAGLPVHYIRHRFNLGQGAALQTGIDMAYQSGADYFVTFDADGQHDVGDIPGMLNILENAKLDIILGSRFMQGASTNIGFARKLLLKSACMLNYLLTGILLTDAHNGLRAFNRHTAGQVRLKENRMAHATEFLLEIKRNGLSFAEYPVHIHYTDYSRKKGQSLVNSIRIFFELVLKKIFD